MTSYPSEAYVKDFNENNAVDLGKLLASIVARKNRESTFVLLANGSVIRARQVSSFWCSDGEFKDAIVQAGDTILVQEQVNEASFAQYAKEGALIPYQFGLGLAGIKALRP